MMSSKQPKTQYHDTSDSESLLSSSEKTHRNSHDCNETGESDAITPRKPGSKSSRVISAIRANWWIVDFTGLTIIIILLAGLYNSKPVEQQLTGDVSGFAPRFSQEITMFRPDSRFFPSNPEHWFLEPSVQQAWLDLVPRGLGYVSIPTPTTQYHPLPSTPLRNAPNNLTLYTTSMTHQLHCLHALADTHYALTSSPRRDPSEESVWHAPHCFEYLRQAILCAGDVALEGQQTTFPEGWDGSDGWDARHVCKAYGEVKGWLEGVRGVDELWI